MPAVQRIQSQQFALEQRSASSDDAAVHRARLAVAAMAARHGTDDVVGAAREALEALGLVAAVVESRAVTS